MNKASTLPETPRDDGADCGEKGLGRAGANTAVPRRVQLSRAKGWRKPPNTVVVSRPSIFGNISTCTRPHHCALRPCACCPPEDNDGWCCVLAFEEYVVSGIENRPAKTGLFRYAVDAMNGYPFRTRLVRRLPELRGKNLACWCAPSDPCHADVLLRIANAPSPSAGDST